MKNLTARVLGIGGQNSELFLLRLLVLVIIVFSLSSPYFFSIKNLSNVLLHMSFNSIMAYGMTLIIISGGIDLSVGAVASLVGVFCAACLDSYGLSIPVSVFLSVVLGATIGLVNGTVISGMHVEPFVATLGMMSICRGMSFLVARGYGISITDERFWFLGGGYFGVVPVPAVVAIVFAVISYILLNQTRPGRNLFVIGGNRIAALTAGVSIAKSQVWTYVYGGALAGVAGVLWASRMATGSPTIGIGWELEVIAAVILGGTSLFGGRGSILGTFLGALFIGTVTDWLLLMDFQYYVQVMVRGFLLILVVGVSVQRIKIRSNGKPTTKSA